MQMEWLAKKTAAALRAHQDALDATKSPQRDKAAEYEIVRSKLGDLVIELSPPSLGGASNII
eukprot:scaffold32884_cov67-Skeletonema_dohrnii-CCMP3373.AAC.1